MCILDLTCTVRIRARVPRATLHVRIKQTLYRLIHLQWRFPGEKTTGFTPQTVFIVIPDIRGSNSLLVHFSVSPGLSGQWRSFRPQSSSNVYPICSVMIRTRARVLQSTRGFVHGHFAQRVRSPNLSVLSRLTMVPTTCDHTFTLIYYRSSPELKAFTSKLSPQSFQFKAFTSKLSTQSFHLKAFNS